jgi:hypothetical protein
VVGGCIKCSDFCLRVGECGGSTGSTQGRASRRFLGDRGVPSSVSRASRNMVETSRRASLVRSERGRGVSFVVSARPISVGRVFGVVFSGLCFSLIVDCGYLLFWYPTPSFDLLFYELVEPCAIPA